MSRWDRVVRASAPSKRWEPIAPSVSATLDAEDVRAAKRALDAEDARAAKRALDAEDARATAPTLDAEDVRKAERARKAGSTCADAIPSPTSKAASLNDAFPQGTFDLSLHLRVEPDRVDLVGSAQGADLDVRFHKVDRREEVNRRVGEIFPALASLLGNLAGTGEPAFQAGVQVGQQARARGGVDADGDVATGASPAITILAHSLTSDQIDAIQDVLSPQQRAMLFELLRQSGRDAAWVPQDPQHGEAS